MSLLLSFVALSIVAVKLCPQELEELSNADQLERWTSLFKGPSLVQRWQAREALGPAENQVVSDCIDLYRVRLGSLSWLISIAA